MTVSEGLQGVVSARGDVVAPTGTVMMMRRLGFYLVPLLLVARFESKVEMAGCGCSYRDSCFLDIPAFVHDFAVGSSRGSNLSSKAAPAKHKPTLQQKESARKPRRRRSNEIGRKRTTTLPVSHTFPSHLHRIASHGVVSSQSRQGFFFLFH